MRAVTIVRPGGPEVFEVAEVPDPVTGPGEVMIEVVATAVNRADVLQRQGYYPPPPGASPYPGLECSGRIVGLGAGVTTWQIGDEVCALLTGGGYAERVAVPAGQVLAVPAGVDLVDAAALPEAAATVWSNLVTTANLRAGETLLVHGGGSGIGTFAIQLAGALGATVLTTARAAKHQAVLGLGAGAAFDYTTEDFVSAVREATAGRGADVILDIVGAKYLARNVEALAPDGRLVIIGMQGGRRAELDLGMLVGKRATVAATTLRSRPESQRAAIVDAVRTLVWPLVASGRIRPVVDRRMPLWDAAAAHRVLEGGNHIGKIVLTAP